MSSVVAGCFGLVDRRLPGVVIAPGRVGDLENTCCHDCGALLVERYGYFIKDYKLTPSGTCPSCGTSIPGRWGSAFEGQITDTPFLPGSRRLRMV